MKDVNDKNPLVHIHHCEVIGGHCSVYGETCKNCPVKNFKQEHGIKQ